MNTNIMSHVAVGKATKQQEQSATRNSSEAGSAKAKKKKRPRIRIRPRNKCCRLAAQEQTVVPPTVVNSTRQQHETYYSIDAAMKSAANVTAAPATATNQAGTKTREEIMAEREAKKLAKQAKKTKTAPVAEHVNNAVQQQAAPAPAPAPTITPPAIVTASAKVEQPVVVRPIVNESTEKTRDQIMAEREAKKLAKQAAKASKAGSAANNAIAAVTEQLSVVKLPSVESVVVPTIKSTEDEKKKPALTKAERRAIQEAQRAAKAQAQTAKQAQPAKQAQSTKQTPVGVNKSATLQNTAVKSKETAKVNTATELQQRQRASASPVKSPLKSNECKVKLFNHLASARCDVNLFINNPLIHPSIARLGEQYAKRTVVGSNARCIAFLNALKSVIHDFVTPPKKAFSRSLETTISDCVEHLQKCRPLAVSVVNAHKHIKHVLTQLPSDQSEAELKENLCHFIDTYIENQIDKAAQAISSSMQEKISDGDVILTFGCSSLINFICEEAHRRHVDFRVIVVDSRPFCEGQELLRRLTNKSIPCTYVLINAVSFVMAEVTKVLLGAHALLSNGYVMGRVGTAQVALVAQSFNVPVLVCCETHKFSERFQTDAIVYNELGNPNDLVISDKCCLTNWQSKSKMSPLNLIYDITPSELVTAVVTEVSILPCTSVPVILRIKPTEIGYC